MPSINGYGESVSVKVPADCQNAIKVDIASDYSQSAFGAFADAGQALCQPANPTNPANPTSAISYLGSPLSFSYPAAEPNNNIGKSLPAVPGAILMGLVGFLCVSLVRDRKVWASAFILIFVLGQFGVHALPRLSARLVLNKLSLKKTITAVVHPLHVIDSSNAGELVANRHYIGLLHRLAGSPEDAGLEKNHSYPGEPLLRCAEGFLSALGVGQTNYQKTNSTLSHSFITNGGEYPADLVQLLAGREQEIDLVFSPAFIFSNISRAPPRFNHK